MKNWFKHNWPHLAALGLFVILSVVYLSPTLDGKVLQQGDVIQAEGMQHEINVYAEKDGKMPLWTNSMFGGMPSYLILIDYQTNVAWYGMQLLENLLPNRVNLIFMYLAGMYFLLSVLGMRPLLAITGAIGFALSSYNIIIIEAGHVNKVLAVSLFAPILASILLIFKGRFWLGAALLALFFSLELRVQHIQMTYYFFLALGLIFIYHIYLQTRGGNTLLLFRQFSFILIAFFIGALTNISSLMLNNEFAKETIRGRSELTLDVTKPSEGLDKEYAFQWSYGIGESLSLLIPNIHGGSSGGTLGKDSESAIAIRKQGGQVPVKGLQGMPTYWGDQPFTSGPVYLGALFMLLFTLSIVFSKHTLKWPLFIAFSFSLILSWGKNFALVNDFFFDYFPLYNKFRSVTSILVIAEFSVVVIALIFVQEFINNKISKPDVLKKLKWIALSFGGGLLVLAILPSMFFDFKSTNDSQLPEWLIEPLQLDRATLLIKDAWRSLVIVVIGLIVVWAYAKEKINATYFTLVLLILGLVDLWTVDKRYLNEDSFIKVRSYKNIHQPRPVDTQILNDPDPNFRVYDATINTFNSASTSYHLKTIGGYNAAKLRRYQDLIDYQISKGNINVLNMLNTKYIIQNGDQDQAIAYPNTGAYGNVWQVDSIIWVENANQEMLALDSVDLSHIAIIDQKFKSEISSNPIDSSAAVFLKSYHPERLDYEYSSAIDQTLIFSEIYYSKGWKAFIDDQEVAYARANYVLRALSVPSGRHEISFRFYPTTFYLGEKLALIGSILLIFLIGFGVYKEVYKMKSH